MTPADAMHAQLAREQAERFPTPTAENLGAIMAWREARLLELRGVFFPHYHATVVTQRGSRRIMGARGARANVCGAAPTDLDMLVADFRGLARRGYVATTGATACPACTQALLAVTP